MFVRSNLTVINIDDAASRDWICFAGNIFIARKLVTFHLQSHTTCDVLLNGDFLSITTKASPSINILSHRLRVEFAAFMFSRFHSASVKSVYGNEKPSCELLSYETASGLWHTQSYHAKPGWRFVTRYGAKRLCLNLNWAQEAGGEL